MKQADPALFDRAQRAYTQYAALCWRLRKGEVEVLLITARDTGRWMIPRGWPMKGRSPHQAALTEAWEEAGVRGTASPICIGAYAYAKGRAPESLRSCMVEVYPVAVDKLAENYPEAGQRRRKWFSPAKAAAKVADPGLAALLARFDPRAPALETAPARGHFSVQTDGASR